MIPPAILTGKLIATTGFATDLGTIQTRTTTGSRWVWSTRTATEDVGADPDTKS